MTASSSVWKGPRCTRHTWDHSVCPYTLNVVTRVTHISQRWQAGDSPSNMRRDETSALRIKMNRVPVALWLFASNFYNNRMMGALSDWFKVESGLWSDLLSSLGFESLSIILEMHAQSQMQETREKIFLCRVSCWCCCCGADICLCTALSLCLTVFIIQMPNVVHLPVGDWNLTPE